MRLEAAAGAPRCGGFRLLFEDGEPLLRLLPGERTLPEGLPAAVLQGLADAPRLLAAALGLVPPPRPYDRVEVSLAAGESTQGEAICVGPGFIRLSVGEATPVEEAERISRHEALHLLLAAGLRGRERWNDPELAFADWIVRGIESGLDPQLPRFHAPLPRLLDPVPASRAEVQRQLGSVASAPAAAVRYFGQALFDALHRIDGPDADAVTQRQLWLVEAALGTHFLETAARLQPEDGGPLHAILIDDWLLDYEQYARAVGNPPSGAGNLWRLSEPGWSDDALTRLSVAAQALQREDHCWYAGDRFSRADEPVVWKTRGRVRLPLLPAADRPRSAPLHGFRAMLRALPDAAEALALVEQAARGAARTFEARALWPRILARLLAARLPLPAAEPCTPVVQLVEGPDAAQAFHEWQAAADALRSICPEAAAWVPSVTASRHASTLLESPRSPVAVLLVHAVPLSAPALLAARRLAARSPVRGALFPDLASGKAHERVPDLEEPLDPRYREELWIGGGALPGSLADLPSAVDDATAQGRPTTPLSHLLAAMGIGLEECHYQFGDTIRNPSYRVPEFQR
ncbi:MAG TPA: hypothetical protein VFE90_07100 [Myxococcales bacterium]|nr:hypothetical protein [Myxococcales bacterium]